MTSPQPTPAQLSFRMPAEWEPHAATWLAWPHNRDTWPGMDSAIAALYVRMIAALYRDERVHICVNDPETAGHVRHTLDTAGVDLTRIGIYEILTNDAWIRDHGPIFLTRRHGQIIELGLTNWTFNAWGAKYPPWDLDNRVPERIAQCLSLIPFTPDIVLEGGSIDVNGQGMLLTTESCLLNPNRNPALSRSDVESILKVFLGVHHIGWLGEGIVGDDTDGHVDDIARFVNPTTVVCAVEDDPADANYKPLRDNLHRLRSMRDQSGQALRVVPLPMPGLVESAGERLPASYANFYIANRTVLVPTYDHPQDRTAQAVLQELFPGRRIRGIPCRELVVGLGALHCVTVQQPVCDRNYQPA
ncbi:MAG: agmatine deiminase family protein [Desulfurellaceae bacterium]|nr:agmatine deiminase family protein [Desulfurellaceae bacterium]